MKKRVLPKINYQVRKFSDYQSITELPMMKKTVYDNLIEAVEFSLKNNKKDADILQLADTDCILCLDRVDWEFPLKEAMKFYIESEEDYDKCIKIRDILCKI